jgi:phage host-nuclease inhibitor protein Gam
MNAKPNTRRVHVWAEANRDALTSNGKTKTVKLAAGEISWRMRPPSVAVRGMAAVIEALKKLKLSRFIRTKEELDKEAVLADPDAVNAIKGISITQREDFVIKPDATELEEVQ